MHLSVGKDAPSRLSAGAHQRVAPGLMPGSRLSPYGASRLREEMYPVGYVKPLDRASDQLRGLQ